MTALVETAHSFEFVLSEANGNRSRENALIKDGEGVVPAGRIVGVVTSGGTGEIGRYRSCDPTNNDGSQVAVAVLATAVNATTGDQDCVVIRRDAEVNALLLSYDANANLASEKETQLTQLATVGIIARE